MQGKIEEDIFDQIVAGPPIDGADALCEQVLDFLDGDDLEWIKRINRTGFLTASEFLALLLYKVREIEKPDRDEKKVILDWAKMIRKAVKEGKIIGLDPDSHTPILPNFLMREKGWGWETSIRYADQFLEQTGTDWRCLPLVQKLLLTKSSAGKGNITEVALKIDYLKLLALFATDERYGYDVTKKNNAISLMQTDLLTRGFEFNNDTIRIYVKQAVKGEAAGLTTSTLQKLVAGLAFALYKYDTRAPRESLLKINKDYQERGINSLESGKIPELLKLASQKNPRNPRKT